MRRELYLMKSRSYKPGRIRNNWDLYCMLIPVAVFYILFHYAPMYGVQIAFKDFLASKGIWGSPWVGMKHFNRFFNSYYFERLLFNTISISNIWAFVERIKGDNTKYLALEFLSWRSG